MFKELCYYFCKSLCDKIKKKLNESNCKSVLVYQELWEVVLDDDKTIANDFVRNFAISEHGQH